MPSVGLEPMFPVFERPKTVHASDGAATVIGKTRNERDILIFLELSSTTEDGNGENLRNVGHKLCIDTADQDFIAYSRCQSVKQCTIKNKF
jgi:hypothetical protein